jgi:hypothetical protein
MMSLEVAAVVAAVDVEAVDEAHCFATFCLLSAFTILSHACVPPFP